MKIAQAARLPISDEQYTDSASENPDSSQELKAHLQNFWGGPPKENSSLHPLHDIAGRI